MKKIKTFIFSFLIFLVYRLWTSTWRMKIVDNSSLRDDLKNGRPVIHALWHGHELGMIAFGKYYRIVTMTSMSDDGQLIDGVLRLLGIKTSKGSSSRKAIQGLKGLLRWARRGYNPVIPVDGPRGPIYEPKPGVFELSRLLGARIYPGAIAASSQIKFEKSWNKTFLPRPFAKVILHWGEPLDVVTKEQDPRDKELAEKLKNALNASGQLALKEIALAK